MKILIVDDHPMVRRGVASILFNEKNIDSIMEAGGINEALSIMINDNIGLVLIDLRLDNERGLDLAGKIRNMQIETKIIFLTSSITYEEFLEGEKLQVNGYILKEALPEDILYAINLVLRGKKYYDPEIKKKDTCIDKLTDRERDVMQKLGDGLSNDEIASQLFISQYTVKKHVSNILNKLNLNNRSQVVLFTSSRLS